MATQLIATDDEAWALLQSLLDADPDADENQLPEIEFSGWPILDVRSKKGQAEIDAITMRGLVSYQEGIWRTYVTLHKGTRSLRRLANEEKQDLLLSVKVGQGSSKYDIDLTEALIEIGKKLAGKLSPRDIIIIILGLGLTFAGQSVWKAHIADNAQARIEKVRSEDDRAMLQTFIDLSKNETERLQILGRAFQEVPETRVGEAEASSARQDLLRNLPDGYGVEIEGIDLPSEVLQEIVRTERRYSEDVEVKRSYFIERAQTYADGFQVRLKDAETEQTLSAHFGDALASQRERALVQEAFFQKKPITLTLDAKQRGELIVSATITHAEPIAN